jgi:hypothetical protein
MLRTAAAALIGLALLGAASPAGSEVYRWQDAQGNTVFSDTPPGKGQARGGTQRIELPPAQTMPAFKPPPPSPAPQGTSVASAARVTYERFAIVSPEADSATRNNAGNLNIETVLEPPLQAGDYVVLYLDGQAVAEGPQTTFQLFHVDRGTHTVHAVVRDGEHRSVIATKPLSFTLLRVSVLTNPLRPRPEPLPSGPRQPRLRQR